MRRLGAQLDLMIGFWVQQSSQIKVPFQSTLYKDTGGKIVAEVTRLHSTSAQCYKPWSSPESGMNQETDAASNEYKQDKLPSLFKMAPQHSSAISMLSKADRMSFNCLNVITLWTITVSDSYRGRNSIPMRY